MRTVATLLSILLTLSTGTAFAQNCLHGATEVPAQKTRRDAALQLAIRINAAQTVIIGPGPQNRRYRRLDELVNIPLTPPGFQLQFHTDGESYSFSIKDRLDPCRCGIFSDQDKYVYEAIARSGPVIVPLDTR